MQDVPYSREFFDLQLTFARAVHRCSGIALGQALLNYTNFYIRFSLGRDFNADNPVWRKYLAGITDENGLDAWTYQFYQSTLPETGAPKVVSSVGCFAYERLRPGAIHVHFKNAEKNGDSPLGAARHDARMAELRQLFSLIREQEDPLTKVYGTSWLYNLPAYRRLFPQTYLASAAEVQNKTRNVSLWGQFVGRHKELNVKSASAFRQNVARQVHLAGLEACFPLKPLAVSAPAQAFYDFHGV